MAVPGQSELVCGPRGSTARFLSCGRPAATATRSARHRNVARMVGPASACWCERCPRRGAGRRRAVESVGSAGNGGEREEGEDLRRAAGGAGPRANTFGGGAAGSRLRAPPSRGGAAEGFPRLPDHPAAFPLINTVTLARRAARPELGRPHARLPTSTPGDTTVPLLQSGAGSGGAQPPKARQEPRSAPTSFPTAGKMRECTSPCGGRRLTPLQPAAPPSPPAAPATAPARGPPHPCCSSPSRAADTRRAHPAGVAQCLHWSWNGVGGGCRKRGVAARRAAGSTSGMWRDCLWQKG